jgi:hypothetical protein
MTTEAKCLEYARECARRAELMTDMELRERLFNIARNWTAARERSTPLRVTQKRCRDSD